MPRPYIPSPCFVMEEAKLIANLEKIRKIEQDSGAKIILALKAFAMHHVFGIAKEYLYGTTASSLHEAKLAKDFFGGAIHLYSPAYVNSEFEELMYLCRHITFNSLAQWELYREAVQAFSGHISAGLRINHEYSEVETDLYNPAARGSRLGMTAEQFGEELPKGIEGLHFHSLCENDADALERTVKVVENKFGHLLHQAKWLNLGGGHKLTDERYQTDLLIRTVRHLRQKYDLEVIMEPGSAIAWQTGFLKTTVLDIVESGGVKTAMIDASFTAHMPDCLEMPYRPAVRTADGARATDAIAHKPTYRLGGLSCLAGDFLEAYSFDEPLEVGDELHFEDMMHYTMVKTTHFNGVNHPAIGMLKTDGSFELFRRFEYEHFRDRL